MLAGLIVAWQPLTVPVLFTFAGIFVDFEDEPDDILLFVLLDLFVELEVLVDGLDGVLFDTTVTLQVSRLPFVALARI